LLKWIYEQTQLGKGRKQPYINETNINKPITAVVNLGEDLSKYQDRVFIEKCLTDQLGLKFELAEHSFPILIIKDL